MFTSGAALALAVALALDVAGASGTAVVFAVAGIVFLGLAVIVPSRPRSTERCHVSETPEHPAVAHPVHLRIRRHRGGMGHIGRANDWLATHLAVVFGVCWTIWVFFIVPVVAYFLPQAIQNKIFFFSSGWIQLFALPLMVYVGNKLQRSSDAQSEVIHQALTHIATVSDQNKTLIEQDNELTAQVHALVTALAEHPAPQQAVQMQSAITLDAAQIGQLVAAIQANASEVPAPPKPAPVKRLATKAERTEGKDV